MRVAFNRTLQVKPDLGSLVKNFTFLYYDIQWVIQTVDSSLAVSEQVNQMWTERPQKAQAWRDIQFPILSNCEVLCRADLWRITVQLYLKFSTGQIAAIVLKFSRLTKFRREALGEHPPQVELNDPLGTLCRISFRCDYGLRNA